MDGQPDLKGHRSSFINCRSAPPCFCFHPSYDIALKNILCFLRSSLRRMVRSFRFDRREGRTHRDSARCSDEDAWSRAILCHPRACSKAVRMDRKVFSGDGTTARGLCKCVRLLRPILRPQQTALPAGSITPCAQRAFKSLHITSNARRSPAAGRAIARMRATSCVISAVASAMRKFLIPIRTCLSRTNWR